MLKSFISINPTTDHRKQFKMAATVKGNGMDFADFVAKTVLRAANGEANMATQNMTPMVPIISAAFIVGRANARIVVMPISKDIA